jgi:hypothetical protein
MIGTPLYYFCIYSQISYQGSRMLPSVGRTECSLQETPRNFYILYVWGAPTVWACSIPPLPWGLTFEDSIFCTQCVYIRMSEHISVIPLHNINWVVFVSEMGCVYCAVRSELIDTYHYTFTNRNVSYTAAVPFQAWTGPEGSRKLGFPDLVTAAHDGGKVVSLTHRPSLPPGNTPGTHFS